MEQLLSLVPIIVPTLGGLTWFAYKHPKGFEYLFYLLIVMWLLIFILCFEWNISIDTILTKLDKYIYPEKWKDARKAADDAKWFAEGIYFVVWASILYYLIFLRYMLPDLIKIDKGATQ